MTEPIAVVGTACRFPGSANSPSKLWELLKAPRDVSCSFPPERLNFAKFYHKNGGEHGCTDVKGRSYLLQEDIRLFDAPFFRINPKEAAGIDPQQRILLEIVYEAFEAAGWPLASLEGSKTSVHVGVMTDDYLMIQSRDPDTLGSHAATGLSRSILANRVSYVFDLKGPSMSVDTACSSSLVALHLAVQGLRNGEASQAVVAGTSLLLDPHWFITESSLHMLSPDARCRMWDKDASGYARGEGCAAVVLKPLSKAIQDGDDIECIIRETGINSDGRTQGLTMPSPTSQVALIRQTYKSAGLDPITDHCQYFECHGTGTQAGDTNEARAIQDAFFSNPMNGRPTPLYCGSIKTVLGHLEGCAGLAGLIKASLAIQHGLIPPNMHFNELNPLIEPFYSNLCVPTSLLAWPQTDGGPRRASVNSFGFGGANAHVILENYVAPCEPTTFHVSGVTANENNGDEPDSTPVIIGPFVFSARSRTSLAKLLTRTLNHIDKNPSLDLDNLSYILNSRRTVFLHRAVIPAVKDHKGLMDCLRNQISVAASTTIDGSFGIKGVEQNAFADRPGILGIFTGQGAQAARMGHELMTHCILFRESIETCQKALLGLPHPPDWSLSEELAAQKTASRLSEAAVSQPMCTALQIALVDLLRAAGIQFAAVVGHSSGEIGAAYASGVLNLRDAMGIAYYRGLVAQLSQGSSEQPGAMMAVKMTLHEANVLCSSVELAGRVCVAASNAPSSITLSGDADAIHEIKRELNRSGTETSQLKVDTAYHSHHMLRCSDIYLAHLRNLDVQIHLPSADNSCMWLSTVYVNTDLLQSPLEHGLDGQYWVENMTQPVLFSEAVRYAAESSSVSFALALEVGPHPALNGPVSQTLEPLFASGLAYAGCLNRRIDATESMSSAVGTVWSHLGPAAIDFRGWREAFGLLGQGPMIKHLPSYAWDHDQIYWRESRISNNYRLGNQPLHHLLGRLRDGSRYEKTWRNILHLSEMPWLRGHIFQGQVLFPGAGYVSLAVEAAILFVQDHPINLLEIRNLAIHAPLVLNEDDGVEILFTIRSNNDSANVAENYILETNFVAYSCHDERVLTRTCDGRLLIHIGQRRLGELPPNPMTEVELPPLSVERFDHAVSEIGLHYEGVFHSMASLSRSWGHSRATASWDKEDLDIGCTLHPAVLDVAFQAGLATFVSNAEKSIGSCYLPIGLRRVIIDPEHAYQDASGNFSMDIEAVMTLSTKSVIEVDINACATTRGYNSTCGIQVEGLILKPVEEPQAANDRNIFVKTIWDVDCSSGLSFLPQPLVDRKETEQRIEAHERIALFYLQNLVREVSPEQLVAAKWHHQTFVQSINATLAIVQNEQHALLRKGWLNDSIDTIRALSVNWPNDVDIEMLTRVGENLPSVVRGESEMMEHMLRGGLLKKLYRESRGLRPCNKGVADFVQRISHKHPRMKILEVGAGTGGSTLGVLDAIGTAYSSYTFTDISSSFFSEVAEEIPPRHSPKVDFKIFDVEKAPATQGFVEGGYDIVIAANVLHATRRLSETVQNTRALLRPGGYLIVVEITGSMLREAALMGALEGWWLGVEEGRTMKPGICAKEWDDLLRRCGFSGIDCIAHDHHDVSKHSCSVFATQATDTRIDILRDPLVSMDEIPGRPVLILGGKTLVVSKLVRQTERLLRRWSMDLRTCDSIDNLDPATIPPESFVLSFSDLDKAFFSEPLSPARVEKLQELLGNARNVLWVTRGRLLEDPHSNMMVGVGRALAVELPHVNIHFLDFDEMGSVDSHVVIQQLLRMEYFFSTLCDAGSILWVQESEIVVGDHEMLIPRVVQDDAANESFNAKRRRIKKHVNPSERITLTNAEDSSSPSLFTSDALEVPRDQLAVDVILSVALHTSDENPFYLCYGKLRESGKSQISDPALVLSEVSSSTVSAHGESIFRLPDSQGECTPATLVGIARYMIAFDTIPRLSQSGTTLIFAAPRDLVDVISTLAALAARKVLFLAVTTDTFKQDPKWRYVHPLASARSIRRLLPRETSALISFSNVGIDCVLPHLPERCAVQRFDPSRLLQQQHAATAKSIATANETFMASNIDLAESLSPITVVHIDGSFKKLLVHGERLSTVVDWTREGLVSAVLQPPVPSNVLSPTKTYLLVGMTGELAVTPLRNPQWLADLRSTGADVRLVKMDVTVRLQVRETVSRLRQSMPEIGGVANGALVLEAGLFVNFSAEDMTRQLKPKVDGTLHLDEEFENHDLDFFLAFGSLASVCGNPGQALYHAGNMFMLSLVEKRRRRGKAASILNFGLLVDVGYVARKDRADGTDIEGMLRSLLMTPLSEAEFHHVVLRGITCGRSGSSSGEVIMGIEPYIDDGKSGARPPWVDRAAFSHMIYPPTMSVSPAVGKTELPLQRFREDLESATDFDSAIKPVKELIYNKIESMIKITKSSIDEVSPLADLGLDSLHGIEIRNWLLKEMQVNMPLLRILGREPFSTICDSVAQQYIDNRRKQAETADEQVNREPFQHRQASDVQMGRGLLVSDSTLSSKEQKPRDNNPPSLGTSSASALSNFKSPFSSPFVVKLPDLRESEPSLVYERTGQLSFAQGGIHFMHSILDNPTAFNVTARYKIKGLLNVTRLSGAIEKALRRHEAFRTCFVAEPGSPRVKQRVASSLDLRRLVHVMSNSYDAEMHTKIAFDTVAGREYSLAVGETFRAVLVAHEPEWHTLIVGFHLIASDALSFSIFLDHVALAYQMSSLGSSPHTFLDFSRQQHEDVEAGRMEHSVSYWKRQLDPTPTLLPLLSVAQVTRRQSLRWHGNHVIERELGSDLVERITQVSQEHGVSPMQLYLVSMQVLLFKLAEIEDICIGVTNNGRGGTDGFSDVVGHFANILPMRFKLWRGKTFEELIKDTQHTVLNALDNAQVPFEVLLDRLGIERSSVSTPLFQVAFNYRLGSIGQRPLGNCTMSLEEYTDVVTPYDLTINVTKTTAGGNLVACITNDNLYSLSATEFIMNALIGLVRSITLDQATVVGNCTLFSDAQIQQAISLGRGPEVHHPWPSTLTERLQEVVCLFPDSVAIKYEGYSLTYTELSHRARSNAVSLLKSGVESGSRVAVLCEPSIDVHVAMLAILQIGAVYMPLDISLPPVRRHAMISEAHPRLLLYHDDTATAALESGDQSGTQLLNLSAVDESTLGQNHNPPYSRPTANQESFLLFTSGSTGTPKGIRLCQRGIMNYAASKSTTLGLGQAKVLQQTRAGFDMAIAQAFNAFVNGGTLIVAPSKARGDPDMISRLMVEEAVELTLCTPSEYTMLSAYAVDNLRKCNSWRHACSGGEAVSPGLVNALRRLELPDLTLTDCYGPTEVSCATTFQRIPLHADVGASHPRGSHGEAVSVGKAIPNTSLYILSDDGANALPLGMPGEIYVGGCGLAMGYLDTNSDRGKFVPDPFATPDYLAQGYNVMYKTGDKGLLLPAGSLKFLGRTDSGATVVKLRGLRIDLTEVAGAILEAAPEGWLADAVVTMRGQPQYLVCHVVFAPARYLDQTQLDDLLEQVHLPQYMVPSIILSLPHFPTTPNGKVDRAALQALKIAPRNGETDGEESLTVPEGELRVVWLKILGEVASAVKIGPKSDFFTVGGSSLLLVHLQNALKEKFGVSLPLQELYQTTILRSMAAAVHTQRGQLAGEEINWNSETAIPEYILEAGWSSAPFPNPRKHQYEVLLTGSTTFLGAEILGQLVANEDINKIHCIAIPGDESDQLISKGNGKVQVYPGSIQSPNLGLSAKDMSFLRSTIDQIIHAATQGHCMNNYSSVKQGLHVSTQSLVSLIALPRRIPFHFVSAPRVVLLSGRVEGEPVSMASFYPPTDGSQGVTAAKWASECFLENMARDMRLPVVIHRHCALVGEQAPADEVMNAVVRFSIITKKVPDLAGAKGFFDFQDVQTVATEIANHPLASPGDVQFCHHSGNARVPFDQLAMRLQEVYGVDFEVVAPSEWLESAAASGMGDLLVIHLKANFESGQPMVFPYLGT
ncbi:lovastatin nonaketide synthase [Dactylonectria macrodidyma]|uniref:Lovastatin nonaketide synthase n=1 Tax=Dactylonectria macrodidyma TaxID=307937 RepID=A0A9P9FT28_9HYPO|nr:lovastatin nonaketide synthase [Dactylonectria macrodidyma]